MSKKEWIKTILAGAGAVALMLLLGDRNAFYNWVNENGLSEEVIPENTGFNNDYLE